MFRGATVREIAARANVTQGLIRHYFSSKEELVQAAYEHHMNTLTDQTAASSGTGSAVSQLTNFVDASLRPPIVDPSAVALWAGFLNKVQHDPKMQRIHQQTYDYFRGHLEKLIVATLQETGRSVAASEATQLAIACNAVIDGLWLEGGALPDAFFRRATGKDRLGIRQRHRWDSIDQRDGAAMKNHISDSAFSGLGWRQMGRTLESA